MKAVIRDFKAIGNIYTKQVYIGREIVFTENQLKDLKVNGFITYEGFQLQADELDFAGNLQDTSKYDKIFAIMEKEFHRLQEPFDALVAAVELNFNLIFYGPGGYGKSEITLRFFQLLKEHGMINSEPFIKSLGEGTTSDDLYGGVDMKLLTKEGTINFNCEQSFLNHEYVIFEEFFDAPSSALLSLKDTLTAKELRNGDQTFPSKNKIIIALTNQSKQEFNKGNSTNALNQRFPLSFELVWKNEGSTDFISLFKKKFRGDVFDNNREKLVLLADRIAYNNDKAPHNRISPRVAINGATAYLSNINLSFIPEFDVPELRNFESASLELDVDIRAERYCRNIEEVVEAHGLINTNFFPIEPIYSLELMAALNGLKHGVNSLDNMDGIIPVPKNIKLLKFDKDTKEFLDECITKLTSLKEEVKRDETKFLIVETIAGFFCTKAIFESNNL